jgi:formylglycine-generating enzyme required for sulfatase activity
MNLTLASFTALISILIFSSCQDHQSYTAKPENTTDIEQRLQETFTNGIGQEMIWITSGKFRIGTPKDSSGNKPTNPNEQPAQVIELSGYHLASTEVTQKQWQQIMGTSILDQARKALRDNTQYPQLQGKRIREVLGMQRDDQADTLIIGKGADHPVYWVSHADALDFCRKLSIKEWSEGRLPLNYQYSLPTEAQWEYACRAGSEEDHAGKPEAIAWYADNSNSLIHPVAKKAPNAWKLHDMHGNVNEWCLSWYADSYKALDMLDPQGPTQDKAFITADEHGPFRVMRGGSSYSAEDQLRSAAKNAFDPRFRDDDFGFRVALIPVK